MKTIVYAFYGPWDTAVCKEDKVRIGQLLQQLGRSDLLMYDDVRYGLYRFPIEDKDPILDILRTELKKAGLGDRVDRCYTRQELLAAELLHLMITGTAAEGRDMYGTRFDWSQACRGCWSGLVQMTDLIIDKTKMGKKDIAKTYTSEVIISGRLAQLFQEAQLEGYELRPVHHHSDRLRDEPVLYQLLVTHTLPSVIPPTQVRTCSDCGRAGLELFAELYYHRQDLERTGTKDFNQTREWYHWIIISQKVYRLLLEHKIRNFKVEVVRVID